MNYENLPYVQAKDYDNFASDIDLQTVVKGHDSARYLLVLDEGSGTLALRFANGAEENFTIASIDIGTAAALFDATKIAAILSATDVGKVRVRW